jgi:hypothetical protein
MCLLRQRKIGPSGRNFCGGDKKQIHYWWNATALVRALSIPSYNFRTVPNKKADEKNNLSRRKLPGFPSEADFSRGLCPECRNEIYREYKKKN